MPKFYTLQEVLRHYKPEWIGKEIQIVGFLKNKRNFVHGFDHVIEVDGERYDARGREIGRKHLSGEFAGSGSWILRKC
jgi:hypothetical protein